MTTPIPQTAPVPKGWAVARGDDGRAALTHDGEIIATAAYGTAGEQASVHALLARLRGMHNRLVENRP